MRAVVLLVLVAVVASLPVAVPWLTFPLTTAVAAGFAALGLGLLLRAGLISLGHAMFFAMGAYATAVLQGDLNVHGLLVLLAVATVVSALAGVIVGAFMVRYRGLFFAMLNLAASMVFFTLLAKLYSVTGGTDGMGVATPTVVGIMVERSMFNHVLFYGTLALALLIGFIIQRYMASPMGQALAAVDTNEVRLDYLGVSVSGVLLAAYTISAALAGLGGALAAVAIGHVLPHMSYWTESGIFLLMAVLGGTAGAAGPFIGAVFLGLVHTAAAAYVQDLWNLIIGIVLLAIIFFQPEGLYGIGNRLFGRRRIKPKPP